LIQIISATTSPHHPVGKGDLILAEDEFSNKRLPWLFGVMVTVQISPSSNVAPPSPCRSKSAVSYSRRAYAHAGTGFIILIIASDPSCPENIDQSPFACRIHLLELQERTKQPT
jgi:hypothetical protein